ncbi:hypothetical protein G6F70_006884 [Rhizopus microsporus]|uniref:PX domain-containing protein n=1 Tax=Rhizopus microsporus TaxID=58291 RepID=A0A1X0RMN0_RHIZD|nr:hypothetical protein G6F71_006968 [Rhizopus microsporus]KAG1197130.1 hypothetical protein G6F70_006884 [Rhizopus microsporus]ORE13323.1 hypothetical protein BCV71DRAFT_268424 [Rhizopus microsporus]
MDLTPQQEHYFKRELISLELERELDAFEQHPEILSNIIKKEASDYPFLQFIVHRFVLNFPLLQKGDERQFWSKLQSFVDEYYKLKINNYAPRRQDSQRRIMLYKLQRLLNISLSAVIKTTRPEERIQVIRQDMDELATDMSLAHLESEEDYLEWIGMNGIKVNIITVRDVSEVRTIREHVHSEFIIETRTDKVVRVARRHGQFRQLRDDLKAAFPTADIPTVPSKAHDTNAQVSCLHREKDRILLRLFLRRLAAITAVAESEIFYNFLTDKPIELTKEEEKDREEREKMDMNRRKEEKRFREQVDSKIVELDALLNLLKQKVMQPNGLLDIFETIKKTEKIDQLPVELQKAIEWGRINLAFVLHTQFVTSDRSVENVANLKRTHSLIPYRTIAQILKLSNPFAMVKGVLDLFLAQPFGGKSLFQRIILANMSEESKEMQKDIQELEAKINDTALCQKISNAVKTEMPIDIEAGDDPISETLELLKNPAIEPVLRPDQILKVAFAHQQDAPRQLVMYLYQLWVLYAKKQEQETLMALVFQGVTGELMKDLFAIFYEPLAEVYKAANIGDTIGHVSHFIDDLIQLIDQLDAQDATNTAQPFIDLVQRHEQQFYTFVHRVHAQDHSRLFDSLLAYVNSIFSLISHGLPARVDLNGCVQDALTPTEYPGLKAEIDALCLYHKERKQRHLERKRQKLMMTIDDEDELDFVPGNKEFMSIASEFADMDDDVDDLLPKHEMNLHRPKLQLVPKVVPFFLRRLAHHGVLG